MAGNADIKNGHRHVGLHHIQHRCHKPACVQSHGFARLKVYLRIVAVAPVGQATAEQIKIIAGPGDVVPAAKVDPAALRQPLPKMALNGRQGALKGICPLFA